MSSVYTEADTAADPLVLTVAEAARRLGISRTLAYELIARGQLPALRLGRRLVVPRRRLERLVEAGPTE